MAVPSRFFVHRLGRLLAALAGLVTVRVVAQEAARPPNFIVVLADDLGAAELGCYGNAEHKTPSLDRLAREGMRFETCYATPICSPTRVALMTGQYGFRTGWFNLIGSPYSPLPSSPAYDVGARLTFADVLKTRGYATALTGKWQLSGEPQTVIRDCGFDEYRMWAYTHNLPVDVRHTGGFEDKGKTKPARYWHPCIVENGKYLPTQPDSYGPDLFNEFAIDFMRRHRDRPFCLYYTSPLTHSPYLETPDPQHPGRRWPKGFKSNLEYLDHLMGRLVAAVDELGLKERTLILFIGDNGTGGRGKGEMTERGVRVPFIVRGPGAVKAGVVSRALTDITDVLPTLADFAGATMPAGHPLDGKSLAPVLRGEASQHRDWILSFRNRGRLIRDPRWLLELDAEKGKERFYDCGESRDGRSYQLVTDSTSPEVAAARARFDKILQNLPNAENFPGLISPETNTRKARRAANAAEEDP
jgi:arylsulfatase A-like enzyme